ncbi:MAG: FtsW/RodA/SpoVE family cell cycle protein [Bacilli bacterium]|nr:FtsW/RodA/SpoVE family cell cycle protein [Bacilli bacterium]
MKKIIKYTDKPLLFITVILFIIGLIMVFSASNVTAYMTKEVSPYNYFIKQGVFLIISLILSLIMVRFTTKSYGFFSWILLFLGMLALVGVLFIGAKRNQAVSWFDLGFFSIQPSEFIKIITIVFLADYYDKSERNLKDWKRSIFPLLVCMVIACLIFIQPDLGTTIIYCAIVGVLFLAVPIDKEIKYKTLLFVCFWPYHCRRSYHMAWWKRSPTRKAIRKI